MKTKRELNWPADKVERRTIGDLKPFERNARVHSDKQIQQLAAAIKEWGWTMPVLIDEQNTILAGHGRVLAARVAGVVEVPVVIARGWSDEKKRAYGIADNKLTENSKWDDAVLLSELERLASDGFDVGLLGMSKDDLARLSRAGSETIEVYEIPVSEVKDEFWISVRGPLKHQAHALQTLRKEMASLEGVSVDLGTIRFDE